MAAEADPGVAAEVLASVAGEGEPGWSALSVRAYEEAFPVLPRQSARCLSYIASHPGSSGARVRAGLQIRHLSQASRVLIKLEREGLAYTDRTRRGPNAWQLTDRGRALLEQLPGGIYE